VTRTLGRKPLPLPRSFKDGLRSLGLAPFVNVTDKGDPKLPGQPAKWRHPTLDLVVEATASSMAGEGDMIFVQSPQLPDLPKRASVDLVLALLAGAKHRQTHPNQVRS
jgi:hypothetical protein